MLYNYFYSQTFLMIKSVMKFSLVYHIIYSSITSHSHSREENVKGFKKKELKTVISTFYERNFKNTDKWSKNNKIFRYFLSSKSQKLFMTLGRSKIIFNEIKFFIILSHLFCVNNIMRSFILFY